MAATYFTYVTNVSNALETLIKTTGVRIEPAVVEFVSCGIDFHEHFVPKTSLKKHLRKCHGEKRARPIPNAAFFYGRRNEEDAVISHDKPSTSVNDSATGRQVQAESDSDIVADIQVPADDTECVDDERSQSSGFQSLVEPKAGQYDKQKTTLDVADGVIAAIERAAVSATTFYEHVQAWHRIPHAFATINDRERALVKQSSLRRWLNAELSRPGVLPSGEALDQELVDYIVGLLEHPDFCEPDLLVLELHEFLGNNNVSNIVLALWKFLIVEIGLQSVFQKREKSEKKRTTIQAQSSVHSHDSMTTSAMLNNNSHTQASDAKSELHYKRRRASYRGKIGTNTGLEAYRDLIQKHMVGLSHEMDWDLVLGGGFQDDDDTHRKNRLTVSESCLNATNWFRFTDALELTPIFEKVATELKGEVNVAKVDVTENGQLGKRFQIRGFPTLLLLSHGKVYKYGGKRTVLDLLNFVRGGYQSMEGEIIAPAPSVWTIMMEHAVDLQKDLITLLETKKNVLLVTFSSGLVLGTVLGCLCGCCTRRGTKSAKVKSE
ncbi:unnamed protein product [Peronospora belbahrii]|uniref:Thioredoxin domain-containing protein n=1 Tax=Peronospora belbahrii TaxID=622444 RepID=A0AAU9L7Q1_9STRA|nr:unnamed protein product [Peronospora belbahrii]